MSGNVPHAIVRIAVARTMTDCKYDVVGAQREPCAARRLGESGTRRASRQSDESDLGGRLQQCCAGPVKAPAATTCTLVARAPPGGK